MDIEVGTGECVGEPTRQGEGSPQRGDLRNRQTTLLQSAVTSWDWEAVYHEVQKPDAMEILPQAQEILMCLFSITGRTMKTLSDRQSLYLGWLSSSDDAIWTVLSNLASFASILASHAWPIILESETK